MRPGRPKSVFQDPVNISCQCEKWLHDIILSLKIPESVVYRAGVDAIIKEKMGDLTAENIQKLIQEQRERIEKLQEGIMILERMMLDAKVKDEVKIRKKKELRFDERGKEYQVVIAE